MRTYQPCTENKTDIIPFFPEIQTQLKPKILIVEKNSANAAVAQKLLLLLNYQDTLIALNGKEAIQLFSASRFEIPIIEVGLSNVSEIELGIQLHSLCPNEYMPLIAYVDFGQKIEIQSLFASFDNILFKLREFYAGLDNFQQIIHGCVILSNDNS